MMKKSMIVLLSLRAIIKSSVKQHPPHMTTSSIIRVRMRVISYGRRLNFTKRSYQRRKVTLHASSLVPTASQPSLMKARN